LEERIERSWLPRDCRGAADRRILRRLSRLTPRIDIDMPILVVDGDRGVRDSLRRALELEGFEVELASAAREALELLSAPEESAAIIVDLCLPGFDRLEVCRRIRGSGSNVPVLILTARDERRARGAALEAGANAYLTKPFALDELRALLSVLVQKNQGFCEGSGTQ